MENLATFAVAVTDFTNNGYQDSESWTSFCYVSGKNANCTNTRKTNDAKIQNSQCNNILTEKKYHVLLLFFKIDPNFLSGINM